MKGEKSQLDAFAFKIVAAHQHCYAKSKQLTTGFKLQDAVRRVAMCYKRVSESEGSARGRSPTCAPVVIEDYRGGQQHVINVGRGTGILGEVKDNVLEVPKKVSIMLKQHLPARIAGFHCFVCGLTKSRGGEGMLPP